jgi:hypothetical protein
MLSLDSLTFDESAFEYQTDMNNVRIWQCPTGDTMGLFFYFIRPDIKAPLDNLDELRRFYRSIGESAGLGVIEIESCQIDGCTAIRTIYKIPQQPAGRTYLGSITIPFAAFSYVFKVECEEQGMTGIRDTLVLQELLSKGVIDFDSENRSANGWVQDPYDSTEQSAMTMNVSERGEYDLRFPDHPLSRARRMLAHLEQTVRLSQAVKASPAFCYPEAE